MAFVREPARTARFMMNEALSAQAFLATEYTGEKAPIACVESAGALLAKLTLSGVYPWEWPVRPAVRVVHSLFFVGPAPPEARFVLTCCG